MTHDRSDVIAQDPVCGMTVDTRTAKESSEYLGRIYYFCSLLCRRAFEDDPEHYLKLHPHLRVQPQGH